jgi:SAM-dependent methyltransferase
MNSSPSPNFFAAGLRTYPDAMLHFSTLRLYARRIPPLFWLAGVVRYLVFRFRLSAENERYSAEQLPYLPPPILRHRVHGALDPESYVNAGRVLGARIVEALHDHAASGGNLHVLDFACGPGRIAAEVKKLEPNWQIKGSDIDQVAVAWARSHLHHVAEFSVNEASPPTAFPRDFFDAIYSVSLFTHLDEPAQLAWLAELHRVTKPGGWAVFTTHGATSLKSCTPDERARIARDGFAFRIDRTGWLKLDGLPDFYQTTFHSRAYVEHVWTRWFDIASYSEGGLEGHQDLIVLRRPKSDK